jgi:hypothetical protein
MPFALSIEDRQTLLTLRSVFFGVVKCDDTSSHCAANFALFTIAHHCVPGAGGGAGAGAPRLLLIPPAPPAADVVVVVA